MNEHTLPDDLSRWPANPYTLLGVPPGVNERDLRRAYTRLIRTYKPEHFPEHFRRIREAYEKARNYVPFNMTFEPPAETPTPPVESRPAKKPTPPVPKADDPAAPVAERPTSRPPPPPRSFDEELDEAWNWAIDGDEARAYAGLLDLLDRYPRRSETCLRLYSLLTVAPELDNQRVPCNFLVLGLRRANGGGPCHELYRREIEDNPDEALTDRFAELLHTTTQPGLLATFVRWRWGAAGKQKRFKVIINDLPGLRAKFAVDQEEIWLRLLAFAVDQLAWDPSPGNSAGLSKFQQEIALHKHLELRCRDVFDRLEYLHSIAVGWHLLMEKCNLPADLLELLSEFWTRPFAEIRRDVTALIAAVHANAEVWLAHLDRINKASPPLLSLFGQMLVSYQQTLDLDADDRDPAHLVTLAQHFLEEHGGWVYSALRPRLLAFCLRDRIDPDVVVRQAQNQTAVTVKALLNKLVNDWPLRHVYRACILFRN